jgi:hypothetical protein
VPIDSTNYCSTSAFDAVSPLFHEVIAALESLNITVEQVQKKTLSLQRVNLERISKGTEILWKIQCANFHFLCQFYPSLAHLKNPLHIAKLL